MFLKTPQPRSEHFAMNCWVLCRLCVTQFYYQATWRKIIRHDASLSNSARWGSQIRFFLSKSHFDHSFYKDYLCMKNGEPEIWFFQPDYVNLVFVTSRQHQYHLGFVFKKSLAFRCNGYKLLQKNENPTINGVDQSENPFFIFMERKPNQNIPLTATSGTIFCSLFVWHYLKVSKTGYDFIVSPKFQWNFCKDFVGNWEKKLFWFLLTFST